MVIRRVSLAEGERLVLAGTARQVVGEQGELVGFQLQNPQEHGRRSVLSLHAAEASITRREMELLAGRAFKFGQSRTAGLTEVQRMSRVHPRTGKLLPPEDAVERAQVKLEAFAPRLRA